MTTTESTELRMPTLEDCEGLVPEGRLPYELTRNAIFTNNETVRSLIAPATIAKLAIAQRTNTLEPPLSPKLEEVVYATADLLHEDGSLRESSSDFDLSIALMILNGVFEHGYKSN